jgi:4'-phosphopantetheinyl transferase EntD
MSILASLLPVEVGVAESYAVPAGGFLYAPEIAAIHGAVPARRREFAWGRRCAREAIAALGRPAAVPIGVGRHRQPLWPDGLVGSITHTDGFCAAAVVDGRRSGGIGVDAERVVELTPGLRELISGGEDLRSLPPAPHWPLVLFSCKEAVQKAWFPQRGEWPDLDRIRVALDPREGNFSATLVDVGRRPREDLAGKFTVMGDLIVAAICLPSSSAPA